MKFPARLRLRRFARGWQLIAHIALATVVLALTPRAGTAQQFVEYPGHPATYGDHQINATWTGGPSSLVLTFESDETILHEDGVGQSQRTARNTLTYAPPSDPANPQDYDDLAVIDLYGGRLPLLQQMSADGTSTLRFEFTPPVEIGFDLFITDVDTADDVRLRAFAPGAAPVDMLTWTVTAEGDLSLFKNTGTGYSDIIAPPPTVSSTSADLRLQAIDATNYNRSYTVLRAPAGASVERLEIEFTGIQNSPTRAQGGNGAHIYVGLSTSPPVTEVMPSAQTNLLTLVSALPLRPGDDLDLAISLTRPGPVRLRVFDPIGRARGDERRLELAAGRHDCTLPARILPSRGIYFVVIDTREGRATRKVVTR